MEFACVTAAILMGGMPLVMYSGWCSDALTAIAERGRVWPAMVFTFIWLTIVYCPLANWAWGKGGWGNKWGVLDYAGESTPRAMAEIWIITLGGGPVEIGSGVAGLAYAWVLGRRKEKELLNFRPHNVSMVALGTFILWYRSSYEMSKKALAECHLKVRLAGLQRWFSIWCKLARRLCRME